MALQFPWDTESGPAPTPALLLPPPPKRRGRRPASLAPVSSAPYWLYHHLIVTGPADDVAAFAEAARGSGVTPWQVDSVTLEEDVFNLAASQPAARRNLTIEGCRILARQFRDRVEARQAQAAALVGRSRACPFDLHTLLPVPAALLALGPTHPTALDWLLAQWGVSDRLHQVVSLSAPKSPRRLGVGQAVVGYGFFIGRRETPHAAVAQLAAQWPSLRLDLLPRPD